MATSFGISTGEIYPQPGFQPSQDQNGAWTATRDYVMSAATWAQSATRTKFANGNAIYLFDTNAPTFWSFLTVESKSIQYEDGGTVRVTVTFAGAANPAYGDGEDLDATALPTYRLEGRLMERPFSDHPKWSDLTDAERFALGLLISNDAVLSSDSNKVGSYREDGTFEAWKDISDAEITLSGNAQTFAKLIKQGQTSYLVPTITWVETTTGASGMTAAQLNSLGKVSTPRGGAPAVAGTRNWMLTGASQEQRGDLYQTTIEWTLSERDGWNSFLYT